MHQGNAATDAEQAALLRWYPRIFFACHRRHVRDALTRTVLSAHQASILDHLDEVDAMTLSDLARHMGVTAGTMSVAIERLVRKGYVRRRRSRADQRRAELRLTEAGLRIKAQQSVLEPELVKQLLEQLDPEQRTRALDGLRLLGEAGDQLMASKSGDRKRSASVQDDSG
jgi:DNA-binding MarR family transcriptional regulator